MAPMSPLHRLRSLGAEVKFAVSRAADPASCARLLWRTAQFHLGNHWPGLRSHAEFEVDLRLPGGRTRIKLRSGVGDIFVLYEVLAGEAYRVPRFLTDAKEIRIIIDAGANIGMTSLYLADRFPQARIFSIEPHPENFRLLCANVLSRPNIHPVHACLCGGSPGPRVLSIDRPAWGNRMVEDGEGVKVPGVTIDSLMEEFDLPRIDILKIDIEGAER